MVAAALLHDIGHLLELRGDPAGPHERIGPTYLRAVFPAEVTRPIGLHVAAKRYLCAVEAGYGGVLSAGSTTSLRRQGGPMTGDEMAAFEQRHGWRDAVHLRRWDDAGKRDGVTVPPLRHFEAVLREVSCSAS